MFYSKKGVIDKRGLSDLVITVSFIAMVVVAVSILSSFVLQSVKKGEGKITAFDACKDIDIYTFRCIHDGNSEVQVILKREAGGASKKVSKLIQFYEKNGKSRNIEITDQSFIPDQLEKISVPPHSSNMLSDVFPPETAYTVAYVLDSTGKETACRVSRKTKCEFKEK